MTRQVFSVLRKRSGFSLIGVLMTLSGMVVVGGVTLSMQLKMRNMQNEFFFKGNLLEIRQRILMSLNSEAAWEMTKSKNSVMNCSKDNQQYCTAGKNETATIVLYDALGGVVLDSSRATSGFTFEGTPCDEYSSEGNNSCPLHVELRWRSVCSNNCQNIEDLVGLQFSFSPGFGKKFPLNVENYNIAEKGRSHFGGNESPVMICARNYGMYIGLGRKFKSYEADEQGCIPYEAFVGPQGDQGPEGPPGPQGPSC